MRSECPVYWTLKRLVWTLGTTACVAVAMSLPDGHAQVLGQARLNLRDRATRSRGLEC